MAEFIQFRKFKPDYTDFVFTQIQEFRNTKDTKLMEGINPFDDDNTIIISSKNALDINKKFQNRYFLGQYIYEQIQEFLIKDIPLSDFMNDPDFWSWLSFVYIKQLTKNFTSVSRMEHYIPAIGRYRLKIGGYFSIAHRHSVREPYRLFSQFREESKFYFNQKNIHQQGNIIESIRSRKDTLNHKAIHEYLILKYSKEDGYSRKGTATTSSEEKGTGRDSTVRLGKLYRRLNIAYIGPLLTPRELADTLGPGFELDD